MFEPYIKKVAEYIDRMRREGRQVTVLQPAVSEGNHALPIRIGPGAGAGIILREDTFAELGNPELGSCAFTLVTGKRSLIQDKRITLIGPDIPEMQGQSRPFGQIIMTGGRGLTGKYIEVLQQARFIGDQIEGYMVRSMSRNVWSRVSNSAAGKGFSFQVLGGALMTLYKANQLRITSMEIVFVTSCREDVMLLDSIARHVEKIGRDLVKERLQVGFFDDAKRVTK
jgi:CO dehydrogenase/acetyl-CoA synthase beta subunit